MGYSHYWYRPKTLDGKTFEAAMNDCKRVCGALAVPLAGWDGNGEPQFTTEAVRFNGAINSRGFAQVVEGLVWPTHKADGVAHIGAPYPEVSSWFAGPKAESRCLGEDGDGSYETFAIERVHDTSGYVNDDANTKGYFACCKTNFRPYDLNVQCCLIVFAEHFGAEFTVSSDGDEEQWNEARSVCQHVLGYGLMFVMDE